MQTKSDLQSDGKKFMTFEGLQGDGSEEIRINTRLFVSPEFLWKFSNTNCSLNTRTTRKSEQGVPQVIYQLHEH